LKPKV